jgi:hypothetical protein
METFDNYLEDSFESYCNLKIDILKGNNVKEMEINERLLMSITPKLK